MLRGKVLKRRAETCRKGCQDKMGNITLSHVWMELNNAGLHGENLHSVSPAERLPVSSLGSRCSNSYSM